ncbi:phospholipase D-like domain-containing protein [Microcoleus sp. OTE_8_concoct_300]|uniref:phospholipase D-like domain-containing protein n=1 Tax=Microcoleus sp. OTE_8_concoct_300 TaxID=2964710 RepID=UPI00403F45F1
MSSEESASLTPEELRRYDNRTGFDLVSCREVGLPVYKITVQVLTQLRKPIPPIEEYVLKAINVGLSSEEDIGGFLGLEPPIIRDAMINLRMSEDIDLIAPHDSLMQVWKLTKKGEGTLRDAKIIVPEERTFDINFDGLLRHPRWYGQLESRLLKPKDLRDKDIIEIEPSPKKPPELSDLKLKDVEVIIRQIEGASKAKVKQERDLLALKAIERRQRFFQPALILIYKAKDSDDVQVAFAIDAVLSNEHEAAFARAKGVKKLRLLEALRESAPQKLAAEVLGHEFVAQAPLQQVEALKEEVSAAQAQIEAQIEITRNTLERTEDKEEKLILEQQLQEAQQQIEKLQVKLDSLLAAVPMRWLEMYEHRPLLEQALQDSQERLMIISPWIRASSVDKRFIQQFENLLKRGVQVFIGYGLGENDDKKYQSDIQAEKNIQKLASQYKDNFRLKRLGDTHAKILISDVKFAVTTSFNWLSFKGDRDRTFRDERGTLVSDLQKIDELFDSYRSRFKD